MAKKKDTANEFMASGIVAEVVTQSVLNESAMAVCRATANTLTASVYAFLICWVAKNASKLAKNDNPAQLLRFNCYAAFGQILKNGIEPSVVREKSKTVKSAIDNLQRAIKAYGFFFESAKLIKQFTVHNGDTQSLDSEGLYKAYADLLKTQRKLAKDAAIASESEKLEKQRLAIEQALENAGIDVSVLDIIQTAKLNPISAKIVS